MRVQRGSNHERCLFAEPAPEPDHNHPRPLQARFSLDARYRENLKELWHSAWEPRLGKWMADLGYHHSRHADEFGAYLLTEPASFWRGRIRGEELRAVRDELAAHAPNPRAATKADDEPRDPEHLAQAALEELSIHPSVPKVAWDGAWLVER